MTATQLSLFCGLEDGERARPFPMDRIIALARKEEPDPRQAGLLAMAYAAFAIRVRDVMGQSDATRAKAIVSAYVLRRDPLMRSVAQVLNCEGIVHNLVREYGV